MAKRLFLGIGKSIPCGLVFFVGTILGGMVAGLAGLPTPALPAGADITTLGQSMLLCSVILAGTLALVARDLSGSFLSRWLSLAFITWIAYGVNTYLEASIFTTYSAASPYLVVMTFVASLLCAAAVAWLFPPPVKGGSIWKRAQGFFADRGVRQWALRLLGAMAAFPIVYVLFGSLVRPFVIEYYLQEMVELTAPGWGQIIPVLLLRSLLFLLACLPVLIVWQGSRLSLFLTLGTALFILVGGVYMLQAYWYPMMMRVAHGLEILADSFAHAGALVLLLAGDSVRRRGLATGAPA